MTPAEMIGEYIRCRDWIEADDAKHAERQAPVKERMQLLELGALEVILASNPASMIGEYIKRRDKLEADSIKFEEGQAVTKYHMQRLEGAVTEALLAAGGESLKTDQGTAYRSTVLAVRCASREDFMDFVFDGRREGFLTSAVAKDAVKEYMSMHDGQVPPGIAVTYIHRTNFRRS